MVERGKAQEIFSIVVVTVTRLSRQACVRQEDLGTTTCLVSICFRKGRMLARNEGERTV